VTLETGEAETPRSTGPRGFFLNLDTPGTLC